PQPQYRRTRADAITLVRGLFLKRTGNALVCFDFPYGYPQGSKLGGGRNVAEYLSRLIVDGPDNRNNRFEVAARLNAELNDGKAGPFWGCPRNEAGPTLTPTLRDLGVDRGKFPNYRIVEQRLRSQKKPIQSVWKLAYPASVGSQALLGLPAIHRLLKDPALAPHSSVWPFETDWDARLGGIVHAEIWPSVRDSTNQPFDIKDARQVAAMRDWALDEDARGTLRHYFARPNPLSDEDERMCRESEGWILGVE
ncbi:MAG TPA: hypothetical protein VIG92_05240, partial [Rhodospirillales bacterium]